MRSSYISLFTPGLTDESIGKSGVKGARRGQTIMAGDGVAAGEKENRVGRKSLQRSFPRIPVEAERRGERRENNKKKNLRIMGFCRWSVLLCFVWVWDLAPFSFFVFRLRPLPRHAFFSVLVSVILLCSSCSSCICQLFFSPLGFYFSALVTFGFLPFQPLLCSCLFCVCFCRVSAVPSF